MKIYRKEWDKKLVGKDGFDAIFIMMNPGALKPNNFYNKLKQLQQSDIDYIHSMFSIKRIGELNKIFTSSKEIKVIVAWGVNSKLRFLINKAISNSNLKNRIGYAKTTYKKLIDFYYYHPLQRGIKKQKI